VKPFAPVRLATRTAGARVFILLSVRDGLATVLSQTSWHPYRVPLEVVRPLGSPPSDRRDERGVGHPAVSSSTSKPAATPAGPKRDLERSLVALPGGGR
jgi:hypothetical protein